MHELNNGLNAEKFASFCMFLKRFYQLYNRRGGSRGRVQGVRTPSPL